MNPSAWKPVCADDFVGASQTVASLLLGKVAAMKQAQAGTLKVLLYGSPGTGKSTLAGLIANTLAAHEIAIHFSNGRELTEPMLARWRFDSQCKPMIGDWRVFWVDEIDALAKGVQIASLSFMDRLPERSVFLATCNSELGDLEPRFHSRFKCHRFEAVRVEELTDWLMKRWDVPGEAAWQIASASGGDVRMALNEVETFFDALNG